LIHHDFFLFTPEISAARSGGRTSAAIDMPATPAIEDRARHETGIIGTEKHHAGREIRWRAKRAHK
jgi:hypothetical protein